MHTAINNNERIIFTAKNAILSCRTYSDFCMGNEMGIASIRILK